MRSLLAALLLAACGFEPALAPGGAAERLRGRVAVDAPATRDGYALRARLDDRLGFAGASAGEALPLRLLVTPAVEEEEAGVTSEGDITRYALLGEAAWRLEDEGGALLGEGVVRETAGFSATGSTVAARAAEEDARERLMAGLADAVAARLLLLP